jgi:hypothetical protein
MARNQFRSPISSRPQQPDEITMPEAAAMLGVTTGAVASWVALGRLSSRLISRPDGRGATGMRVVKRADVERIAAGRAE